MEVQIQQARPKARRGCRRFPRRLPTGTQGSQEVSRRQGVEPHWDTFPECTRAWKLLPRVPGFVPRQTAAVPSRSKARVTIARRDSRLFSINRAYWRFFRLFSPVLMNKQIYLLLLYLTTVHGAAAASTTAQPAYQIAVLGVLMTGYFMI